MKKILNSNFKHLVVLVEVNFHFGSIFVIVDTYLIISRTGSSFKNIWNGLIYVRRPTTTRTRVDNRS